YPPGGGRSLIRPVPFFGYGTERKAIEDWYGPKRAFGRPCGVAHGPPPSLASIVPVARRRRKEGFRGGGRGGPTPTHTNTHADGSWAAGRAGVEVGSSGRRRGGWAWCPPGAVVYAFDKIASMSSPSSTPRQTSTSDTRRPSQALASTM